MTREEAINYLEMSMAIGEDDDSRYHNEVLEFIIKSLEQQLCEDCISRQAVIDGISKYFHDEYYQRTSIQDCRDCLIEDVITKLPSVTPSYNSIKIELTPFEDCISRQAVIDEMGDTNMDIYTEEVKDFVRSLPPVTPQPKTGRWLEKEINNDKVIEEWQSARCSVCDKYHTTPYMYYFDNYKFCPNCGARMEVE